MKYCIHLLLFLTVILNGCRKENANPVVSNMIKTKTYSIRYPPNSFNTETYTYDSLNRISTITNSAYNTHTLFRYVDDTLFEEYYSNGSIFSFTKYQLNNRKLQTELLSPIPGHIYSQTEKSEYDNNDFLSFFSAFGIDNDIKDTMYNDGLNNTARHLYASGLGGDIWYTYSYSYYPKKNTLGNVNFGKPYLGKSSALLIATEICNYYHPNYLPPYRAVDTTQYSYEYDEYERVVTQSKITISVNTVVATGVVYSDTSTSKITYTYY